MCSGRPSIAKVPVEGARTRQGCFGPADSSRAPTKPATALSVPGTVVAEAARCCQAGFGEGQDLVDQSEELRGSGTPA